MSLNLYKEKKAVTESIFRGRDSVSPIERTGRVPITASAGYILAFQILIESIIQAFLEITFYCGCSFKISLKRIKKD